MQRRLPLLLLATLLALSFARGFRWPYDFAEAHWLFSYDFGFMRRGLAGSLLSFVCTLFGVPVSERIIASISLLLLTTVFISLLLIARDILIHSRRATCSLAVLAVLYSSGLTVALAQFNGYLDHLVMLLAFLSILMVFRNAFFLAFALQSLALLIHEHTLLISLPAVTFAAYLKRARPSVYLFIPLSVFCLMLLGLKNAETEASQALLSARLSQFPFLTGSTPEFLASMVTTNYASFFVSIKSSLFERLFSLQAIAAVLPTMLLSLYFLFRTYSIKIYSVEGSFCLSICLIPQSMHLFAWDTDRVWYFSLLTCILLLWIFSNSSHYQSKNTLSPFFRPLCCLTVFCNSLVHQKFWDGGSENIPEYFLIPLYASLALILFFSSTNPNSESNQRADLFIHPE